MKQNQVAQLVVGCIIALAAISAITALEMTNHEYGMVITIAGPVLAALLINTHVSSLTEQQNEKIGKIEAQTNGVLDKRIEDGVVRGLVKAGALTPEGSPPAGRHAVEEVTQQQP